jgi:hypothetical protein
MRKLIESALVSLDGVIEAPERFETRWVSTCGSPATSGCTPARSSG